MRLAILLAVFNRREKSLEGLRHLHQALAVAGQTADVYLVDDGSTDGTADAVAAAFPATRVVRHAGGLYWCRAMHLAWTQALPGVYDHYLWLNDDTLLTPDGLGRMLAISAEQARRGEPAVVVGAVCDATTGQTSYSAMHRRSRGRAMRFTMVMPSAQPQICETMNGNVVLVPAAVVARVGIIDPAFEHGMGDFDYGLRVSGAGLALLLCAGHVGNCSRNPSAQTFLDRSAGLRHRMRHMLSPKGLPWRSWLRFTRRHAGAAWPLYFIWPYVRVLLSSLLPRRARPLRP
jgi:GT2 family glycosyltransferase